MGWGVWVDDGRDERVCGGGKADPVSFDEVGERFAGGCAVLMSVCVGGDVDGDGEMIGVERGMGSPVSGESDVRCSECDVW